MHIGVGDGGQQGACSPPPQIKKRIGKKFIRAINFYVKFGHFRAKIVKN